MHRLFMATGLFFCLAALGFALTCLAVCPYSKPDTLYHRILRFFVKRNAPARRLAFFLDNILYGKRPRHTHKAEWFSPA